MKLRNYTEKLSWDQLQEIFSNHEELEKNGKIGDCLLRSLTREVTMDMQLYSPPIILWMDRVASDCYRLVAEKAIEKNLIKPEFFKK